MAGSIQTIDAQGSPGDSKECVVASASDEIHSGMGLGKCTCLQAFLNDLAERQSVRWGDAMRVRSSQRLVIVSLLCMPLSPSTMPFCHSFDPMDGASIPWPLICRRGQTPVPALS